MFCAPQHRIKWEGYLCFCRCIWPQRKLKEDDPPFDPVRPERLHFGYSWRDYLEDDGSFVGFFQRPVRVGASILIYGRREGYWPIHCMAGPDWPGTILVLFLIIAVHAAVLGTCTTCLGWPVQVIGWSGCLVLVIIYCSVTFSNPGLIFNEKSSSTELEEMEGGASKDDDKGSGELESSVIEDGKKGAAGGGAEAGDESASEDSQTQSSRQLLSAENESSNPSSDSKSPRINPITSATVVPQVPTAPPKPRTVACGQCAIQRPMQARHCQHCGQCVLNIDHHCPWSGKCIAENNMAAFNSFLCVLCFEVYFMIGLFVYYWVACYAPLDLPKGAQA